MCAQHCFAPPPLPVHNCCRTTSSKGTMNIPKSPLQAMHAVGVLLDHLSGGIQARWICALTFVGGCILELVLEARLKELVEIGPTRKVAHRAAKEEVIVVRKAFLVQDFER
eukprot:TRINITY_DN36567_c0_g2_i1.p4 TRINITY_DN36567_c0_g2~~TRINITY_DN36567_c0_g2_i1.p4  ORF type:complete len:111 (+),score=15.86 TRINITY_DN36567_c0_g2_i1:230-562(+)